MHPHFTFGTLCSGIDAASEAFLPLGAECLYVSEIEPYPCGVLADRQGAGKPMRMPAPDDVADQKTRRARLAAIRAVDRFPRWANRIPNYGDLTQIEPEELPFVDLLVAGFPCQDFSIAGLRQSLEGARGNLTLYGVKLIHELARLRRIRSVLLEQVPDILNTKDNAFGALLGGLVGHDAPIVSPLKGGRWTNSGVAVGPLGTAAWRVEDAQYSGVAQRRERLFLVASFGDGPDPVEVLLERQGLSRNPPTRGKAGEGIARPLAAGSAGSGGYRNDADTAENLIPVQAAFGGNNTAGPIDIATARSASHTASGRQDFEIETFVVEPMAYAIQAGALRENPESGPDGVGIKGDVAYTVEARSEVQAVAYSIMPQNSGKDYKARVVDVAQPLMAGGPVGGDQGGDYIVQPVAFNLYPAGRDSATHASETDLSYAITARGEAAKNGNGLHIVEPVAFDTTQITSAANRSNPRPGDPYHPLAAAAHVPAIAFSLRTNQTGANGSNVSEGLGYPVQANESPQAVAFSLRGRDGGAMPEIEEGDVAPSLRAAGGGSTRPFVAGEHMAVRRITVVEASRLQGFPDFYTLIEWPTANRKGRELNEQIAYLIGHGFTPERAAVLAQTPDGPQYKALGNSKAVPHVRKIGAAFAAALQRHIARQAAA